jgi:acetylornithine deacetylase
MTIDPFAAEIRDGKLYGRGACDVKGSMAAMLFALERLNRERPSSASNVILACTVDEEFTFLGVQQLVKSGIQADFAVVAEPTRLNIVDAHKGVVRWKVTSKGKACHSSRPELGENAIYRMGKLLLSVEQYAEALRGSRNDPRLGPPTLSVGRIDGGTSVNTVPDRCTIEIDRRLLPGESAEDAFGHFRDYLATQKMLDFPFECEPPWLSCPALNPTNSAEAIQRLGDAIKSVRGHFEVIAVPFGTDASSIAEKGIPSVVFGPGDIAQAHTCDEWIDLAEVEMASEILFRLATT